MYGIGKHPDDMDDAEQERLKDYMALVLLRQEDRKEELKAMFGKK